MSARTKRLQLSLGVSPRGGALCSFGFEEKADGIARTGRLADAGIVLPQDSAPVAVYPLRVPAGTGYAFWCENGYMYFVPPGGSFASQTDVSFSRRPAWMSAYGEEESLVFSDGSKVAVLTAEGIAYKGGIPTFDFAAYSYERLWVGKRAEEGKLYYSAPRECYDFVIGRVRGGTMEFPDEGGAVVALVAYENDLYLFRERRLQRLRARGVQDEFELVDIATLAPVAEGTVAEALGKLVWLGADGLHSFDGSTVRDFFPEYAACIADAAQATAAGCAEAYVLLAPVRTGTGVKKMLGVFGDEEAVFFRTQARSLSSGGGKVFVCGDGVRTVGKGDAEGVSFWEGEELFPFGGGRALLREAVVTAEGEFLLRVRGDGVRTARVHGGTQRLLLNLPGRSFVFSACGERGEGSVKRISALFADAEGGET